MRNKRTTDKYIYFSAPYSGANGTRELDDVARTDDE